MLKPLSFLSVVLVAISGAIGASTTRPSTQPAPELTLNIGSNTTMKLVLIPAGTFMMGSPDDEKDHEKTEGPLHQVTISRPFYMGRTPVTQKQWKAVMGASSWKPRQFGRLNDDNPVNAITWIEAMQFCNRLSTRTGKRVRLPTEAQWEYACRAGTQTRFHYGDDPDADSLGDYAWYSKNSWNINEAYPHAVARKKPNAWGLYDMHGNVEQWCSDWFGPYPGRAMKDPTGAYSGTMRVIRGGSFILPAKDCRDAWRTRNLPGRRVLDNGCRVVVLP